MTRLADLEKLDLHAILRGLLSWDLASRLDRELPTHLLLPPAAPRSTIPRRLPLASAKAQAFYGMASDTIAGRRPHPVAAGAAVPRRAPDRGHRRPGRLLERRLGRRAPRHARTISQAPLAGRRLESLLKLINKLISGLLVTAPARCHVLVTNPAIRRSIQHHASRPNTSPAEPDGLATVLPEPVPQRGLLVTACSPQSGHRPRRT